MEEKYQNPFLLKTLSELLKQIIDEKNEKNL